MQICNILVEKEGRIQFDWKQFEIFILMPVLSVSLAGSIHHQADNTISNSNPTGRVERLDSVELASNIGTLFMHVDSIKRTM